jgi:hypothetical protein
MQTIVDIDEPPHPFRVYSSPKPFSFSDADICRIANEEQEDCDIAKLELPPQP